MLRTAGSTEEADPVHFPLEGRGETLIVSLKQPGAILLARERQREVRNILSGSEMRKSYFIAQQRSLVKCLGGAGNMLREFSLART